MVYFMEIYADGGCRRNGLPGAIGAAAACVKLREGGWGEWDTIDLDPNIGTPTNQRAEIGAIVLALRLALKSYKNLIGYPDLDLEIFSDSRYAVNSMTTWIYKWHRNGWRNAAGNPVANAALIQMASGLDDEVKELGKVTYTWIPRERNAFADKCCNDALDKQESKLEREKMTAEINTLQLRNLKLEADLGTHMKNTKTEIVQQGRNLIKTKLQLSRALEKVSKLKAANYQMKRRLMIDDSDLEFVPPPPGYFYLNHPSESDSEDSECSPWREVVFV